MYENTREEGFGEEVKRRIILGTFVLSSGYYDAYYLKGQKVRTLIKQDFENALEQCDVIAAPVTPYPAFKLGEKLDDLPVGLQLMGRHFDEAGLITVGHKFQQATDFHTKETPL